MHSCKKTILILLFSPLLITHCSCWKRGKKSAIDLEKKVNVQATTKPDARLYYQFVDIKNKEWLARSGNITVSKKEVKGLTFFRGIEQTKKEHLFALIYQQFIAYEKKAPQNVVFYMGELGRSVEGLLNQFGLPFRPEIKMEFKASKNKSLLAIIDNQEIRTETLNKTHYLWGRIQTLEFQGFLKGIDQIVKEKRVLAEAKKQNLNVQDYLKEYVYKNLPAEPTEQAIEEARSQRSFPKNEQGRASAKKWLTKKEKEKHYDFFLEKYLLELPIQISLKPPKFDLQIESEYVPHFGPQASEVELTLFTDTINPGSDKLSQEMGELLNEYQGLSLEIRPVLASENSFDLLKAKIDFCIWNSFPKKFLDYFAKTRGQFSSKTHEILFAEIEKMKLSRKKIEKCLHGKEAQKAIEYHKQYARYLGLFSGPVVFVSGEVLGPQVNLSDLKKVINRQLNRADAALWE